MIEYLNSGTITTQIGFYKEIYKVMGLAQKLFGTHSEHELKRIYPIADKIESYRESYGRLSDEELKGKTKEFKDRLAKGETLDDILPEAFATVREAGRRVLGMEHYRVQLIGGIILHQGRIAEMKTGEGKTLVCTLPAYLNALTEEGVIVVTVNDYLAKRDAEQMGMIHEFLGLKVGVVLHDSTREERQAAYGSDITYVTNNELGFDYLRDNMAIYKSELVLRNLKYCIIDEVDSVLIDEARTPLIISGQSGKSTKLYELCDILARQLQRGEYKGERTKMQAIMNEEVEEDGDFIVNEKDKVVNLTEQGIHKVEQFFHIDNYADPENLEIQHNVTLALRAHNLMFRDKDYVVKDDEVLIVDEFTGRIMPGRRYSDGLHQAIEAKEHVKVKRESKTLATITFQNFFNKFEKKAGMTGTALTEEKEFREIYNMDVVEVPTNKPVIRVDYNDAVFKTKKGKFNAVVQSVIESHEKGQPVLVGTITIETSELLSEMLRKKGIPHNVLNAKYHELEAQIVSEAGRHGAVTIATNMAGRGTDIKLDDEAVAAGGLKIIGTERHESRRIDNQLRGRAGRQGDPGESQFYLSLEDELMRRFGSDRIKQVLERLNADDEDIVIKSRMLTRQVEAAQKRVEGNNYDTRKQVLQYDDVMREQREIIYAERYDVITAERDLEPEIKAMIKRTINRTVDGHSRNDQEEALKGILNFARQALVPENAISLEDLQEVGEVTKRSVNYDAIKVYLNELAADVYDRQIKKLRSEEAIREFQKVLILMVVDNKWTDHIDALDQLRNAVGLRGYAQNNPIVEYQSEGFKMFQDMIGAIEYDVTRTMMKAQIHEQSRENVNERVSTTATGNIQAHQADANGQEIDFSKVGRNDFCPCGSGKKFKNCHGRKQF